MKYYADCFVIGRHNPSKIGGGYTVFDENNKQVFEEEIRKSGFTNNEGELRGVEKALDIASEGDTVSTDSKCIWFWVRSGNPKARPDLKEIASHCKQLVWEKRISLIWEEREKNLAGIHNENKQKNNRISFRDRKKFDYRNKERIWSF